jgi:hypothetical protein
MQKLRLAVVAAMSCCAFMLVGAGTASAQNPQLKSDTVPITGTNKGKDFKGTFKINRFEQRSGKLYAVGTLKGTLKNRKVTRRGVAIPASATETAAAPGAQASQLPLPAACDILHLTLGPLDLNLLGLVVHLDRVVLDITAQPGPGNLLGNLLCAITGILDPGDTSVLDQIATTLNAILAILRGL